MYLNLVVGDQHFQFFLQSSNTRLESTGHCVEIDRYKRKCVLNDSFVADFGVQCVDMIM